MLTYFGFRMVQHETAVLDKPTPFRRAKSFVRRRWQYLPTEHPLQLEISYPGSDRHHFGALSFPSGIFVFLAFSRVDRVGRCDCPVFLAGIAAFNPVFTVPFVVVGVVEAVASVCMVVVWAASYFVLFGDFQLLAVPVFMAVLRYVSGALGVWSMRTDQHREMKPPGARSSWSHVIHVFHTQFGQDLPPSTFH